MSKRIAEKLTAFLLVTAMLCTFVPVMAVMAADSGTCGDNLTWEFYDGTLTISGTGDMYDWDVEKNNYPPWYEEHRRYIKNVIIENGITHIGDYAFYYFKNLTNVVISESVSSIGELVFEDCFKLENIDIDEDNKNYCFVDGILFSKDMTVLIRYLSSNTNTSYTIPDNVTSIRNRAFSVCCNLVNIDVSENNMNYCSVDGVLFNKDMTTLIQYPTGNNNTSYIIPDSVTYICDGTFSDCDLTSVTIGNKVAIIGNKAFYYCKSLKDIVIPNNVSTIGNKAFLSCENMTSISIGSGVTFIGNMAFHMCNLMKIDVDEDNKNYCSVNGVLFSKNMATLIKYPNRKKDVSYTIPDNVTSIDNRGFEYCYNLKSITLSDNISYIDVRTFEYCGLSSIIISDNVTYIADSAFWGCYELENIYYTGTEEQWNKISVSSGNDALSSANITYKYGSEESTIPAIGDYAGKADIALSKIGSSIKLEITLTSDDTSISKTDIDVFAASDKGIVKLSPTADGNTTVFNGNIKGDGYRVFIWNKSLSPITNVYTGKSTE